MCSQEPAAASMKPSGGLPGITDTALAHPKKSARGSIGTTVRERSSIVPTVDKMGNAIAAKAAKRKAQ